MTQQEAAQKVAALRHAWNDATVTNAGGMRVTNTAVQLDVGMAALALANQLVAAPPVGVETPGAPPAPASELVALVQEWQQAITEWQNPEHVSPGRRLSKAENALRAWTPAAPQDAPERCPSCDGAGEVDMRGDGFDVPCPICQPPKTKTLQPRFALSRPDTAGPMPMPDDICTECGVTRAAAYHQTEPGTFDAAFCYDSFGHIWRREGNQS